MNFRIGLTSDSNVWIGAWWIGFLAAAVICFVIAIPVLAFPAVLPGMITIPSSKILDEIIVKERKTPRRYQKDIGYK